MVGNLQNITYSVFLTIATNIPVLLMTGFVLQGHINVCVCFVETF